MAIIEQLLTGPAAACSIEAVASLRLDIFREYPYLYFGRREDELNYLQLYVQAPDAFIVVATDSGSTVGAATGAPLIHEDRQLIEPFAGTPYPVERIFYIGELLFLMAYRNQGCGLRLIARIEHHVRSLGTYRYLTCATVVRAVDHQLRPADYVPIDRFLARAGFISLDGVTTGFSWCEADGVSRNHLMQFWLKELC